MKATANNGPIAIINVSGLGCYAILIEHNDIKLLELPDLDKDKIKLVVLDGTLMK